MLAARQSPFGRPRLITGISRSATSDETTRPRAAPTMTPTASANAFCFSRNSRNSRHISPPLRRRHYRATAVRRLLFLLFLRRIGRDDARRGRGLVAGKLPQHLAADRQDERETVIALHAAD